uniref:Uncharacterized protein n=1 Tax=Populus alba TaxID=43335 RepID=A0A4V6A1C3_POPAL|nr:hypothetical protein D5086_0000292120 [Populus alba]
MPWRVGGWFRRKELRAERGGEEGRPGNDGDGEEMKATGDGEEKSLGWRERKTDRGKRGRVVWSVGVGQECERRPWFGQETEAAGEEERELGAKQRREVEERSGKRKGDQRLGKVVGRLQLKRE